MPQLFLNNARAVLAESVSAGATLLRVRDTDHLPTSLASGDYFLLTLFSDTTRYGENIEVVRVTAVTSGQSGQLNLTVERGFEFPPKIHTAGERLEARLTAQSLRDLLADAIAHADAGLAQKLDSTQYSATDVLAKLLTVDTNDAGLNATTLQGRTLANLRSEIEQAAADVVASSPEQLDTLQELANALNNDADFAATVSAQIGKKLDKSAYTAQDVLAKLLTVDGAGSGVDADTVRGRVLGRAAERGVGTASGDLMEVGAYGLGAPSGKVFASLAEISAAQGLYAVNSSTSDPDINPDVRYSNAIVLKRYGDTRLLWLASKGDLPQAWIQSTYNQEYGTMAELVSNVNSVGAVGDGNPAIIERVSNSNGEYIKLADGTLICIGTSEILTVDRTLGSIFSTNDISLDFPHTFKSIRPTVITQAYRNSGSFAWANCHYCNDKVCTGRIFAADNSAEAGFRYVAFGRWK